MRRLLLLTLATGALLSASGTAQNVRLLHDSFEYEPGFIGGVEGGKGFTGTWWSGDNGDWGAVEYPGHDRIGGMLRGKGDHAASYHLLDMASMLEIADNWTLGKDGTTLWFRFSLRRIPGGDEAYGGMVLNWQFQEEALFIGSPFGSDELGIEKPWVTDPVFIPGTNVDFASTLVTRIDFKVGDDRVRVWADPLEAFPETNPGIDETMPDIHFNELKFISGSGSTFGYEFDQVSMWTPSLRPLFSMSSLVGGTDATLRVETLLPGATVQLAYSLSGAGPSGSPYGDLALSPPVTQLPPMTSNGFGVLTTDFPIPFALTGRLLWVQAIELQAGGGGTRSNAIAEVVQ